MALEEGDLLAGPAEDRGVAALQPDDPQAPARQTKHQAVDCLLGDAGLPGPFAGLDADAGGRRQLQNIGPHQGVVEDRLGGFDGAGGAQGQKIGGARTCAHQQDFSGFRQHRRPPSGSRALPGGPGSSAGSRAGTSRSWFQRR